MDMQRACLLNDHLPDCDTFFFFFLTQKPSVKFSKMYFSRKQDPRVSADRRVISLLFFPPSVHLIL